MQHSVQRAASRRQSRHCEVQTHTGSTAFCVASPPAFPTSVAVATVTPLLWQVAASNRGQCSLLRSCIRSLPGGW